MRESIHTRSRRLAVALLAIALLVRFAPAMLPAEETPPPPSRAEAAKKQVRNGLIQRLKDQAQQLQQRATGQADASVDPATPPTNGTRTPAGNAASQEELLKRLREIEAEVRRIQQPPVNPQEQATAALLLEESSLQVTNYYSKEAHKYLATRLVVINLSEKPLNIPAESVRLKAGATEIALTDRPEGFEGQPVRVGNRHLPRDDIQPFETLEVPPGGTASAWLVFAGLERGPFIPPLTLQLTVGGQPRSIDVNAFERARLGLATERVGPASLLGMLTIRGELNTVNVGALAAELESLAENNVARVVVTWTDSASIADDLLRQWLMQIGAPNPYSQQQFSQLPSLPSAIRELHLANVPKGSYPSNGTSTFETAGEAVTAALKSALQNVPVRALVKSIQDEHPLVKIATLRVAADRLDPDALPLVLELASSEEPALRRAALAALGGFADPRALAVLETAAREGPAEEAAAAVEGLASSNDPQARQLLVSLIGEDLPLPRADLIRLLAQWPRPEWSEAIYEASQSDDPNVRVQALQALARIGHPRLHDVLAAGLASSDRQIRTESFQLLAQRGDLRSEQLLSDYTLARLREGPPEEAIVTYLQRTRDQRAVPFLIESLEQTDHREAVIQLLGVMGDESVADRLVKLFESLNAGEQVAALHALQQLESPALFDVARKALRSEESRVLHQAANVLRGDHSDENVKALAAVLQDTKNASTMSYICGTLGSIATPAAREVLLEARKSKNERLQQYARYNLQSLQNQSPANMFIQNARRMLAEGAFKDAETLLDAATRLDGDLPLLFVVRAQLWYVQKDYRQAIEAARRAVELEPTQPEAHLYLGLALVREERYKEAVPALETGLEQNPDHHEALTSLAIALVMDDRPEEALKRIEEASPKFRNQPVFLYNAACVHGRIVESLRAQENVDREAVRRHADQAIDLLKASFEKGVQEATGSEDMQKYMWDDPDLQSLRSEAGFRELAGEHASEAGSGTQQ